MSEQNLNIGRLRYANVFPLFYAMALFDSCEHLNFIDAVPSELNLMLREGSIHISPSSSIEYLKYPELYTYIPNHSISATAKVGSIYLFTDRPIEHLGGHTIYLTAQSDTSSMLLRVILGEFYRLHCRYIVDAKPQGKAFMLIGDDAILFHKQNTHFMAYDLASLWYEHTGLPFVFALWIVRKEVANKARGFCELLAKAKDYALNHLKEIAPHCPLAKILSPQDVLAYWQLLDYDLTDRHLRGLRLFANYCKMLNYQLF